MRHDSAERHILGVAHPGGGYDLPSQTRPIFLYNAPTTQVSLSYVYSFGSYRFDTQTHKQTDSAENIQVLRYATAFSK